MNREGQTNAPVHHGIEGGRLRPTGFATHLFELSRTEEAYGVFGAADTPALRLVLTATPVVREGRMVAEELVGAW